MAAGIRKSTTTDWLLNAGTVPSSDRTVPVRGDRRGQARDLFEAICAAHSVPFPCQNDWTIWLLSILSSTFGVRASQRLRPQAHFSSFEDECPGRAMTFP